MSDSDDDIDILANLLASADDDETPETETTKIQQSKSEGTLQNTVDNNVETSKSLQSDLSKESKVDNTSTQPTTSNSKEPAENNTSTQPSTSGLKDVDLDLIPEFLDDIDFEDLDDSAFIKSKPSKSSNTSVLNEENQDSSDDEDKRYFENQRYSEYGREIKNLIKSKRSEPSGYKIVFKKGCLNKSTSNDTDSPQLSESFKTKVESPSLSSSFNKLAEKSDKYSLQTTASPKTEIKKDVYSDPVFGLRIVKPVISSAELTERMQGRKAVTVSGVKQHLYFNKESKEDWVIAGVIMKKSAVRMSQKGSQYIIVNITDMSTNMNSVTVFFFKDAYKQYWKLPTSTVIAILNPSILDSRKDSQEEATLAVDNPQKIMVMGLSKDLGKCRSMKKDGQPCSAPVNISRCEYCVYHVKQEYGKFSKRSDLQASGMANNIGGLNKLKKPSTSMYQQRVNVGDTRPFVAIPAKRNEAQYKKDCERLALLRGDAKPEDKSKSPLQQANVAAEPKLKATATEFSGSQMRKDLERLNKLRVGNTSPVVTSPVAEVKKPKVKVDMSVVPKLGNGMKGGIIDLSDPVPKLPVNRANRAKMSAIEYARRNGGFRKTNPNCLKPSKEVLREKGEKRRREEVEEDDKEAEAMNEKKKAARERFLELMEKQSAHADLIERHHDEETEKYFSKLEAKERMEEKMLTTFKIACKAVRCNVCKYVAFSSSDLCKKLRHPIKVIDAVKRFFKCADCGNRTVSLDRIPTETCKRCASSRWVKTAMMDEKRTELAAAQLCIRGAEEKFIGSTMGGASLDLCVPDTD